MTCRDLVGGLVDYLEGSVASERNGEVEGHLRHCPACTAVLHTYQATRSLGRELPPKKPSPDFRAQLFSSMADKGKREAPAIPPSVLVDDGQSVTLQLLAKES